MNTRGLPVRETIDTGWNVFKDSIGLAIGVMVATSLIPSAIQWFAELATIGDDEPGPLVWVAIAIVEITLELGAVNVFLKLRDRQPAEFADLFNVFPRVPVFFIAVLIAFFAILFGFIMLIIPGIIVALRLQFIPYIVLDEDIGPLDAVQRSWNLTRGFTFDLFLYGLLLLGINILGIMALGIGVFVSAPVTGIATADMYRFLRHAEAANAAPATSVV
jgi:uncharacterized membrane protein